MEYGRQRLVSCEFGRVKRYVFVRVRSRTDPRRQFPFGTIDGGLMSFETYLSEVDKSKPTRSE